MSKYEEFRSFLSKYLAAIVLTAVVSVTTTAAASDWFASKILEIRDERISALTVRLEENGIEIQIHQEKINILELEIELQQQDINTLENLLSTAVIPDDTEVQPATFHPSQPVID